MPLNQINIEELYQHRFREGTGARSDAYKDGYRAGLERASVPREQRSEWFAKRRPSFDEGAAESDAWFSGYDHACEAVRRLQDDLQDEARAALNGGW